ncbi:protein indeterminate-domain 12-like [Nymphaea colorata]|nr:protein indeterminate-domain 12-like [Nymphaea colorata]
MSSSISEEASVSSGNNNNRVEFCIGVQAPNFTTITPPPSHQQPAKKKRSLPGNPDPDAEVIALSPKTLMATNRFICEICNKGFQRDQNLQLHRRGHNLPWKLRQRTSKEMRKRVYVCPEPSCIHHDPSRALGDLTGIKKHFCRKHGEKKWKCEKCSKKYAVQSDWKAHSKICGTREYRCDCGTLFSRKDSFITHRAFCDALAEESARLSAPINPLLPPSSLPPTITQPPLHNTFASFNQESTLFPKWDAQIQSQDTQEKKPERCSLLLDHTNKPTSLQYPQHPLFTSYQTEQQSPLLMATPFNLPLPPFSPHLSATALLQKAAEMGATLSSPSASLLSVAHMTSKGETASAGCMQQELVGQHPHTDMEERIAQMVSALAHEGGGGQGGSGGEVVMGGGEEVGSVQMSLHAMLADQKEGCKSQFTRDFLGGCLSGMEIGVSAYESDCSLRPSPTVAGFRFSPAAQSWQS